MEKETILNEENCRRLKNGEVLLYFDRTRDKRDHINLVMGYCFNKPFKDEVYPKTGCYFAYVNIPGEYGYAGEARYDIHLRSLPILGLEEFITPEISKLKTENILHHDDSIGATSIISTGKSNYELLDEFAKEALGALISKSPFFDRDGEHGIPVSKIDLKEVKKGLCATAYEYAGYMLIQREKQYKWLEENQANGHLLDKSNFILPKMTPDGK